MQHHHNWLLLSKAMYLERTCSAHCAKRELIPARSNAKGEMASLRSDFMRSVCDVAMELRNTSARVPLICARSSEHVESVLQFQISFRTSHSILMESVTRGRSNMGLSLQKICITIG